MKTCPTFWGSHGCSLPIGHPGDTHYCFAPDEEIRDGFITEVIIISHCSCAEQHEPLDKNGHAPATVRYFTGDNDTYGQPYEAVVFQ